MKNQKLKITLSALLISSALFGTTHAQEWNFEDKNNLAQGEISLKGANGETAKLTAGKSLATSNAVKTGGGGIVTLEISPTNTGGVTNVHTATKRCHNRGEGWRLPTIDEVYVMTLIGVPSGGSAWYWTSTPLNGQLNNYHYSYAWVFQPSSGLISEYIGNLSEADVRCVRSVVR